MVKYDLDDVYQKKIKYYLMSKKHYLNEARKNYLARKPISAVRSNYYITGNGGAGRVLQRKR